MSSKELKGEKYIHKPKENSPNRLIKVTGTKATCNVTISVVEEKEKEQSNDQDVCNGGLCNKCVGYFYQCGYGKYYN